MNKTHIIRLYPTIKQEIFFKKSCGVARFAYNWGLSKCIQQYEQGITKISAYDLIKELVSIKREQFPWMLEVGKCAPQYALHNLEKAYKAFFRKQNKYPKFKKKGKKDSFITIENKNQFQQKDFKIKIPRLGWVKCAENLRFQGDINHVNIKRIADKWFAIVSIKVEDFIPNETPTISENQTIVGVDLGIKFLAVTSNGFIFKNPKTLQKNLKQLKRLQRRFSKKQKGSKNKQKAKTKLARKHYRISCIRKNALHQVTTKIVNYADVIVLEDLNLLGMLSNHNLARSISDSGLGEFRRQIEYKAAWQNKEVIIADRYFPSSKTCSNCGHVKKDLKLSERIYKCENCSYATNRDLNAAKNLANYGSTLKARGSNAFGEGSSLSDIKSAISPSSKKELKLNLKIIKT